MNTIDTMKTKLVRRVSAFRSFKPNHLALAVATVLCVGLNVSDASAYGCVHGFYRTACASRYGTVGIGPNGAVAVGRYGNVYAYHRGSGCFWRNGQRICL
jgi:hypothetical protein